MREILFKAKRIDNGQWVEGYYMPCPNSPNKPRYYIVLIGEAKWYEISKETLCQYTGLKDKNGKRIWENDVLHVVEEMASNTYRNGKLVNSNCWTNKSNFKVEFIPGGLMNTQRYSNSPQIECSVIGNVFDNPELLGHDGG